MGYFGSKYSKISPTKDRGHDTASKNKFNKQQENNDIVQHVVDKIVLQDRNTLSAEDESHRGNDFEIDENGLYEIDNVSLNENK